MYHIVELIKLFAGMVRRNYIPIEIILLKDTWNFIEMYKTYFLCIERSEIIGGIKFCKTTVFPYRKNQLYKLLITWVRDKKVIVKVGNPNNF